VFVLGVIALLGVYIRLGLMQGHVRYLARRRKWMEREMERMQREGGVVNPGTAENHTPDEGSDE
jgi:hypothetical protein